MTGRFQFYLFPDNRWLPHKFSLSVFEVYSSIVKIIKRNALPRDNLTKDIFPIELRRNWDCSSTPLLFDDMRYQTMSVLNTRLTIFLFLARCTSSLLTTGNSLAPSSAVHRKGFGSVFFREAPPHNDECCCSNDIENCVKAIANFDRSYNFKICEIDSVIGDAVSALVPSPFSQNENLVNDVTSMIKLLADFSLPDDNMSCRLALINGVRCPKWHEDTVKMRLIKTYYGRGTEWADPNDLMIRANNHIRSMMDWDLEVKDETKIRGAQVNDILIISGKNIEDASLVPVLHRSPPVRETDRRLLFTVTIS